MTTSTKAPHPTTPRILVVVGLAAVLVLALVLAAILGPSKTHPADALQVTAGATGVPAAVSAQVGAGAATAAPSAITGAPLTDGSNPEILYIGAEYCPYCAAERWALVAALSRFGTFTNLSLTHSSSADVYPDTQTFSFDGASFTSPYLTFEAVETATNQLGDNGEYQPLETPTPAQEAVWLRLDPKESIPFVDIGGRYLITGATYDPGVLQGRSATQIAAGLADPSTPIARGVLGAANAITAAICEVTGTQPAACRAAAG
jgi:hypothetical protein